jgi:carbonic anhydrase
MTNDRFATAITCIDGRVQRPITDWMKLHLNVDHVDLVTEPGADKVLSDGPDHLIQDVMRKVSFSLRHHFSQTVAISGHDTCAANPVSREEHIEQIKDAIEVILSYRVHVRVLGLWVNEWGSVELVWDSESSDLARSSL